MTRQDKVLFEDIHRLMSQAMTAWANISDESKELAEKMHNEHYTIGHCIRWGEIAISEVRDELEIQS